MKTGMVLRSIVDAAVLDASLRRAACRQIHTCADAVAVGSRAFQIDLEPVIAVLADVVIEMIAAGLRSRAQAPAHAATGGDEQIEATITVEVDGGHGVTNPNRSAA